LQRLHTPRLTLPALLSRSPSPTSLSTLSLHDALPISWAPKESNPWSQPDEAAPPTAGWGHATYGSRQEFHEDTDSLGDAGPVQPDRKSTRLNSSHVSISYAVFCLKKKKQREEMPRTTR